MLRSRALLAALLVVAAAAPAPAGAAPPPAAVAPAGAWSPPVAAPVVRGFEPLERPFGPRHLGLDYAVPPGTPVSAAGDGVVAFAGRVGRDAFAVAVDHVGGRRTTYAYLARVDVRPGAPVRRGDVLGESGAAGPGHGPGMVHLGYRVDGRPEDPAPLFATPPARISLAPLDRPACHWPARPPRTGVPFPPYPGKGTPVR
ncbi:MAG TPA: M23 family metallopeptidase [Acidimicrobiia bacterium]|nr:M23 family metallopeptidase [Acidimicrobiia bacterium]